MRANTEERANLWKSYLDSNDKTSLHMAGASMRGYRISLRYNEEDEKRFFDDVLQVYKDKDNFFGRSFVESLFPRGDNVVYYIDRLNEIKEEGEKNAFFRKQIGRFVDELERKKACYTSCMPDLMRLAFDINIWVVLSAIILSVSYIFNI